MKLYEHFEEKENLKKENPNLGEMKLAILIILRDPVIFFCMLALTN